MLLPYPAGVVPVVPHPEFSGARNYRRTEGEVSIVLQDMSFRRFAAGVSLRQEIAAAGDVPASFPWDSAYDLTGPQSQEPKPFSRPPLRPSGSCIRISTNIARQIFVLPWAVFGVAEIGAEKVPGPRPRCPERSRGAEPEPRNDQTNPCSPFARLGSEDF